MLLAIFVDEHGLHVRFKVKWVTLPAIGKVLVATLVMLAGLALTLLNTPEIASLLEFFRR